MMFVVSQNTVATNIEAPVIATSTLNTSHSIEASVKSYFKDEPLLVDIARCESRFIQFDKDGSVHRGRVNNKDVGVMQVNEYYHLETAKKLGMDIYTLEGNMEYARYLYEREGPQPWSSSSPCWGKAKVSETQIAQK